MHIFLGDGFFQAIFNKFVEIFSFVDGNLRHENPLLAQNGIFFTQYKGVTITYESMARTVLTGGYPEQRIVLPNEV